MKLVQNKTIDDIIGRVTPPPGVNVGGDTPAAVGRVLTTFIQLIFFAAGLMLLLYLLWGALDWIMAGGDPDNLQKARHKIRDALIGIIVLVAALVFFVAIAGQMLGIIDVSNGIRFTLPQL